MASRARIHFGPKHESVIYQRPGLKCEVMCYLDAERNAWHLYESVPRINGEKRAFSSDEKAEVLPEITRYLSRKTFFWITVKRYEVRLMGA